MRRRALLTLTVVTAAAVVGTWGYVAVQLLLKSGTCYDIQDDPDTVRACDAYARHIVAASGTAVVMSVALAILLVALVAFRRTRARE